MYQFPCPYETHMMCIEMHGQRFALIKYVYQMYTAEFDGFSFRLKALVISDLT